MILKHFWNNVNLKKMNKMKNLINDDFEPSSSDESYNESDNGSDNNTLND